VSERSVESLASFVRDLGSPCSVIRLVGEDLLAGSHEGVLSCWDSVSGTERWRVEVAGPISDLAVEGGRVFATASASLHAVGAASGELLWSRDLEGASDYVQAHSGMVWATSSVYELEVADFVETTIWRFDASGEEQERWVMAERPWHLGLHEDGGILLGLGRPLCGYLRIRAGEKPEHFPLGTDSPVTCGACGSEGRFLLGHADGTISTTDGTGASDRPAEGAAGASENLNGSLVTTLTGFNQSWIAGHDDGTIASPAASHQVEGAIDSVAGLGSDAWASSSNQGKCSITILTESVTTIEHDARVRQMYSKQNLLAIGDDLGRVFVIESEVASRRLSDKEDSTQENFRNSELRARLRMLRNR